MGGGALVCSKALKCSLCSRPSGPVITIGFFSFCIRHSECLYAQLVSNSDISGNGPTRIVVNHDLDLQQI